MRRWVPWPAVAAFLVLSIAGPANWSGYWGSLVFAVPLAVLGSVATLSQRAGPAVA